MARLRLSMTKLHTIRAQNAMHQLYPGGLHCKLQYHRATYAAAIRLL